jgi:hypothetical protein
MIARPVFDGLTAFSGDAPSQPEGADKLSLARYAAAQSA